MRVRRGTFENLVITSIQFFDSGIAVQLHPDHDPSYFNTPNDIGLSNEELLIKSTRV